MRTFNGLQIFTKQLTNSGQLDLRYVRISGNDQPANIFLGNLQQDYDFYKNTNFNINKSVNIFYSDDNRQYSGYLPDVVDKTLIIIKNLTLNSPFTLTISGYSPNQQFDQSNSELLTIGNLNGGTFLGVKNQYYTGWISVNKTNGVL